MMVKEHLKTANEAVERLIAEAATTSTEHCAAMRQLKEEAKRALDEECAEVRAAARRF